MEENDDDMEDLDAQLEEINKKKKLLKKVRDRKLRLRSNNRGKSNIPQRVSLNFRKFSDSINKRREENGFDALSYPKISELLVKHKKYSNLIKNDIVFYNTILDNKNEEVDFNDK